jgi:hypothetical protein
MACKTKCKHNSQDKRIDDLINRVEVLEASQSRIGERCNKCLSASGICECEVKKSDGIIFDEHDEHTGIIEIKKSISFPRNGFDKAQTLHKEKVQRIVSHNPKKEKRLKTAEALRANGYTKTWYSVSLRSFSNEKFTRVMDNIPIHEGRLKFWQVMTLIQEEGLMRADFEWCMPPYYAWDTFVDIENFFCHENIQFRFKWNK